MVLDIEIKGAADFEAALKELGKSGGQPERALRNALGAGARIVRDQAIKNLEDAHLLKKGNLQKGVKEKKISFKSGNINVQVVSLDSKSYWFEYGTDERYRTGKMGRKARKLVVSAMKAAEDKRGYTGRIKPYGFMRNAFLAKQREALDMFEKALQQNIDRQTRRLKKRASGK